MLAKHDTIIAWEKHIHNSGKKESAKRNARVFFDVEDGKKSAHFFWRILFFRSYVCFVMVMPGTQVQYCRLNIEEGHSRRSLNEKGGREHADFVYF